MYLGIKLVIAKTIERIHRVNLINFAITPATFADAADYDRIKLGDQLEVLDYQSVIASSDLFTVKNLSSGFEFQCRLDLSDRERKILLAGGKLNYTKEQLS